MGAIETMTVSAPTAAVQYAATPGLWRLAARNLLLTALTAGIYRFWARTHLRRYFWRQLVVAGQPLEYTGNAAELFIGFLIAIAIFVPLSAIPGVVQILALDDSVLGGSLAAAASLCLLLLWAGAQFRARRYRLSRTAWRGIAAAQDGGVIEYCVNWACWRLLGLMSLGLALPWTRAGLQRYLLAHTRLGAQRFSFAATGRPLFVRWMIVWLLGAGTIAAAIAWTLVPGLALVIMVLALAALVHYRGHEFRYFAGSVALGDVGLRSALSVRRVGTIYAVHVAIVAILGTAFFAGVAYAVIASGMISWPPDNPAEMLTRSRLSLTVAIIAALLPAMILNTLSQTLWLRPRLLAHFCRTVSLSNPEAADRITAGIARTPRFGEGLADSFDAAA